MERVLVIDEDVITTRMLRFLLSSEGYDVTDAQTPARARALLESNSYDLVILEAAFTEMDGVELCREIRRSSTIPIIFLSSRTDVKDRVAGIRAGADDYIVKPFEPAEVLARVWTALSRQRRRPSNESSLTTPDFNLDLVENRVTLVRTGETIELTATEARLLHALISNAGHALTRDALVIRVCGYDNDIASNQLEVYISRLRGKLEEVPSRPRLLLTVRGVGYKYQSGTVGSPRTSKR